MESKGNKILKNVKMRWMFMLNPLKKIMSQYKPLLAIMQANQMSIQMAKVSVNKPFQWFLWFQFFLLLSCNQIFRAYSNFDNGWRGFEEWKMIDKPEILNFFLFWIVGIQLVRTHKILISYYFMSFKIFINGGDPT